MRDLAKVVSIYVDVIDLDNALNKIEILGQSKQGEYICLSNVHMVMEAVDSREFCDVVNNASLVLADGKPISVVQALLGFETAAQVRGQDLFDAICSLAESNGKKIGLYGGSSQGVLDSVIDNLITRYPNLDIAYSYSPPFRKLSSDEDDFICEEIKSSGVDVLFIGIGCPKQEQWMAEHKQLLPCVMLGVGAAFDFISGSKKHAPRWLQNLGLEWAFRLCSEPTRLWKRYLKQNPRFLYYCFKQLFFDNKL